jgi:hypothetical protein
MNFEKLILSVSEMFNNPDIITEGLTLTYTLPEKNHRQLHEEIFFKNFGGNDQPELTDEYEVTIGGSDGIIVKFIKEKT